MNNNIIMSLKAGSPIVEQFVFYDPIVLEYRMIGVTSNNGIIGTFIYSSKDGIDWKKEKLLFDSYMDAHFSVVIKDNLYIVYHRTIFNGRRAVGRFVLDNNYNILEEPKLVLVSPYNDFAHVYNSAASLIKNKILFFPTMYDSNKDMMYISVGYEDNNEFFLTDLNITEKLYKGENIKWGIVMPGLIQTSESDIFWLYYEGSTYPHNERRQAIDNISRYYRIKIKITTQ